jgi:hypothetical protein
MFEKSHALLLLGLVALLLLVYLTTLSPTISGGDTGELVTVAHELGVAHPPGYPLYTLIGHALTHLPFGTIAWRVNLASALCATGCGVLIYLTLVRWLREPWAAFLGAGLFCFSPSVWRYAVVAEVFSLNNLCLAGLLYASLRYGQSADRRWIYLAAAIAGLGLANHHSLIFALVPLVPCLLIRDWKPVLRAGTLLTATSLFLAGLTPYAYLPWASSKRSLASWGDLTTLGGFLDHLLRREYGTFRLASDSAAARAFDHWRLYLLDSVEQLLWVGFLLAVWGAVWTLVRARRAPDFGLVLLALFLFHALTWHPLANIDTGSDANREILSRFWQMPNLLLCLLAARGLADAARFAGGARRVVAALSLILVLAQVGTHYRTENASKDTAVLDFGRAMLDALPPRALFLVRGDVLVNAVRYLQHCDGFRTDVIALPVDLLSRPWIVEAIRRSCPELRLPAGATRSGAGDLPELLELNRALPAFMGLPFLRQEEATLERSYEIWHVGFAYRLVPRGVPFTFEDYVRASESYSRYEPPDARDVRGRPWATFIREQYWAREQDRAERLSLQPTVTERGLRMVLLSTQLLERIVRRCPDAPPLNLRTLGFAYWKLSRIDAGYRSHMVGALQAYLARNPADPHADEIEDLLRSSDR